MARIILDAKLRNETGRAKVKGLRDAGIIPAVVYKDGKESQAISLGHRQFVQMFHQHRLEGTLIDLKIKDDKKEKNRTCLIKEIQYEPVLGDIVHVDFHEVSLTEKIKVNIPVATKGESVGVKQEGGSLEQILWELDIECLPTDIPEKVEVDVTNLKMSEAIHVKDLKLPENIKVFNDPESIVVQVVEPMKEEVPVEAVEGEAPAEPEVIKEKKPTPEEAAEAAEGKEKKEKKEEKKEK